MCFSFHDRIITGQYVKAVIISGNKKNNLMKNKLICAILIQQIYQQLTGANLSEERFFPGPLSKDFYFVFFAMV